VRVMKVRSPSYTSTSRRFGGGGGDDGQRHNHEKSSGGTPARGGGTTQSGYCRNFITDLKWKLIVEQSTLASYNVHF
jgi:hypothetical protein